jgi:valyl-tRNA synthetase
MDIEKSYEPQRIEPHWAKWWVEQGLYKADVNAPGRVFSLVVPPPNVTGSLHMGHMFDHTLIDVAVRWHRMLGDNTLWLPGTDHAGIATQMVVERELAKEGKTRHDLGREEFEKRVWCWKEQSGGRIIEQMKRAGSSCDWSRERFTMDPGLSRAVREAFVRLWEKGLIYRAEYMVNWCPRCQTALSDLEVDHEDVSSSLWYIRYPFEDGSGFLTVATTRPETMLGDTAIAMNPEDPRARELADKKVRLPLMDRLIPIVLDKMVDPKFGTGFVKVTPAHDQNDFECGKRHSLPFIKVIDENAKITAEGGAYAGMDRFAARKKIVADLEAQGLIEKIDPYMLSAAKCHRCKTIVEPLVSKQWWLRMQPLAEPAIKAVEDGRITFVPGNWANTYFQWMYNIRDWCISRQLWWGHRIPAWYCDECGEVFSQREDPTECPKCKSAKIRQDNDVLDTWFSSGLWPFSTMGWPDATPELSKYYPTTLLVTGFDIIFFWVARMIFFGLEMMGDVPFRQVHIHGLIRDAEGQKMSKTKGNVIDPLEVNEKYGTDAVRMALLISAAAGADISLSEDRLSSVRAFANKIWNASRLLFMNIDPKLAPAAAAPKSLEDRWIQSRFNAAAETANRAIGAHRYHEAGDALWHFFWDEFCDWYLELKKLNSFENPGFALDVYERSLRLLHPMMPFITEELWQRLGRPGKSISLERYPQFEAAMVDAEAEAEMTLVQEIIVAARGLRADRKIDRKLNVAGVLWCHGEAFARVERNRGAIEKLANVTLEFEQGQAPKLEGAVRSTPEFDLILDLPEDPGQRDKLMKEIEQLEKLIANSDRQLSNEDFMKKAPEKVIVGIREKKAEYEAQVAKNRAALGVG